MELEITLREVSPYEEAIEDDIRQRAAGLEQFYSGIMNCRVVVEAPHRSRRTGRLFNAKIELYLPNKNIVVTHEHPLDDQHEDIFVALRHAFDAADRRLEDYARIERGVVKAHETPPYGKVVRIFHDKGYGFIETPEGKEIYFHQNSVLGGKFDGLRVGSEVRFSEEMGDKGPQASTVRPVGKHHPVGQTP